MKVKYLHTEKKIQPNLAGEEYDVLGFGGPLNNMNPLLIINDLLEVCNMDPAAVMILDNDLSGYIQANSLNYNNPFFIKADFYKYCKDFSSYSDITSSHIWNRSKTINYFLNLKFNIPEHITKTVLNREYKMNLIEGYLLAVNNYILIRNGYGFWEKFYFTEVPSLTGHIPERFRDEMKTTELDISNYKQIILEFLTQTIFLKNSGESESVKMINDIYKLIDSIFINALDSITNVMTFYDNEIIIGYESRYYSLCRNWGS